MADQPEGLCTKCSATQYCAEHAPDPSPAAHGGPIPLNEPQQRLIREWAADDRLWTTQETVEINLRTFARFILKHGDPAPAASPSLSDADVQLLAWAVTNCHMLARRALARSVSVYDREKWEHVLRICEKAGARSSGVLRAAVPTEITGG